MTTIVIKLPRIQGYQVERCIAGWVDKLTDQSQSEEPLATDGEADNECHR